MRTDAGSSTALNLAGRSWSASRALVNAETLNIKVPAATPSAARSTGTPPSSAMRARSAGRRASARWRSTRARLRLHQLLDRDGRLPRSGDMVIELRLRSAPFCARRAETRPQRSPACWRSPRPAVSLDSSPRTRADKFNVPERSDQVQSPDPATAARYSRRIPPGRRSVISGAYWRILGVTLRCRPRALTAAQSGVTLLGERPRNLPGTYNAEPLRIDGTTAAMQLRPALPLDSSLRSRCSHPMSPWPTTRSRGSRLRSN